MDAHSLFCYYATVSMTSSQTYDEQSPNDNAKNSCLTIDTIVVYRNSKVNSQCMSTSKGRREIIVFMSLLTGYVISLLGKKIPSLHK